MLLDLKKKQTQREKCWQCGWPYNIVVAARSIVLPHETGRTLEEQHRQKVNLNIKWKWGVLGMRVPLQHSMSLQEARAVRSPAGRTRGCQVRNWFLPIWQQYLFGNIQTNNDWVLSYCLLHEHDRLWGCIVCNLNFFYQCAWIEFNPNCLAPTLT